MIRNFIHLMLIVLLSVGWTFEGGWDAGDIPADHIVPDTTNFDNNLSSADDDLQKALDTLDELVEGGGGITDGTIYGWTDDGLYTFTSTVHNVGIGTSIPGSKLEVNGDTYISGELTAGNVITAEVFGSYFNFDATSDTFIGNPAGSTYLYGGTLTDISSDNVSFSGVGSANFGNMVIDSQSAIATEGDIEKTISGNYIRMTNNGGGFPLLDINNVATIEGDLGNIITLGGMTTGGSSMFGDTVNSPSAIVHINRTTEQLRVGYNTSNYYSTNVGSTGAVNFNAVGSGSNFNFSDNVGISTTAPQAKLGVDGGIYQSGGNVLIGLNSGNVGIGTSSTLAKLDVSWGGTSFVFGADSSASTRTNNTQKIFRIGGAHYTNAQNPVGVLVGDSGASANNLQWGGGSSAFNAATDQYFWTGATTTTPTGTARMRINSAGDVSIGHSNNASALLHLIKTTEQLRSGYDTSNYFNVTTGSTGTTTFDAVGASSAFSFSDNVGIGTAIPLAKLQVEGAIYGRSGAGTPTWNSVSLASAGDAYLMGDVEIDGALYVDGMIYGTRGRLSAIPNCDTVDTDSLGNLVCGTDSGGGGAAWGSITGSITAQTDLAIYALDTDLIIYTPQVRTVNGKALTSNITLNVQGDIDSSIYALDTDLYVYALASSLSGYVPTTRTINNKPLSSNVTLTSGDIDLALYALDTDLVIYTPQARTVNAKALTSNIVLNVQGDIDASIYALDSDISDTAYASSWNGVTTNANSKNAIYDILHVGDTDDDGKADVVDLGTAGLVRTTSGGVISADTTIYTPQARTVNSKALTSDIVLNMLSDIDGSMYQLDLNGTGIVRMSGTTVSYDATIYQPQNAKLSEISSDTYADDNVTVYDSETTSVPTSLPSCSNATTSKLLYNTSTNAFSCGTDQSGGAGASWTEAEVNFGTTPTRSARFTVTDGTVSGSSKIIITQSGNVATGRFGNDAEWDSIMWSAQAGTGQFTLTGFATGPIRGYRKFFYTVN